MPMPRSLRTAHQLCRTRTHADSLRADQMDCSRDAGSGRCFIHRGVFFMTTLEYFRYSLRLERGRHSFLRAVWIAACTALKPVPF